MDKHDDLLPQGTDRAALGVRETCVELSDAVCEPCDRGFADTQSEQPVSEANVKPAPETGMRKPRGCGLWKRHRASILAVLFALAVPLAGLGMYHLLCVDTHLRVLPLDAYTVTFYRGSDGLAYGATRFPKLYRVTGPVLTTEDQDQILYVYWQSTLLPIEASNAYMPNPQYGITMMTMPDGSLSLDGKTALLEIRQGTKEHYITVYQKGDALTPIDPAAENGLFSKSI